MSYATILKEIRESLNFTQQVLADELGVSFSTINRRENDAHMPSKMGRKVIQEYCERKHLEHLFDKRA